MKMSLWIQMPLIGVVALFFSYSQAQNPGPKKVDEWDRKQAATMVDRLRSKLPAGDPENLVEALAAWREVTSYLRSSQPADGYFVGLLRHKDPTVRREVALLLAEINRTPNNAQAAMEQLAQLMSDTNIDVRVAALHGLSRMVPLEQSARPRVLKAFIEDADPRIRRAAYVVVSRAFHHDKTLIKYIVAALDDPDMGPDETLPGINSVSGMALYDIILYCRSTAKNTAPRLKEIVTSKKGSEPYRFNALRALAVVAPEEPLTLKLARQWIANTENIERFMSGTGILCELGPYAKDAVPDLIAAAQTKTGADPYSEQRLKLGIASALQRIGPAAKAALPVLEVISDTKDISVRMRALEAIKTIRGD